MRNLKRALKEWLKTEDARRMGLLIVELLPDLIRLAIDLCDHAR